MDSVIDYLVSAADSCEQAGKVFEYPLFCFRVLQACDELDEAWSGSWLEHSTNLYIEGFRSVRSGERREIEMAGTDVHTSRTVGHWRQYTFEEVKAEILQRSKGDYGELKEAVERAKAAGEEARETILAALAPIPSREDDENLRRLRKIIAEMKDHLPKEHFVELVLPEEQFFTRDQMADPAGLLPPHLQFKCWVMELWSYGHMARHLAEITRASVRYLQHKMKMKGNTVAKTKGTIFIGHGSSLAWLQLSEFIEKRLKLIPDEFNRESSAGETTIGRLEEMLDSACFAFLVMTADEEGADGTKQARANVIHEAGLFQGRLGFKRAIILKEDGCSEFSNIVGLTQIRFPKGNIKAAFEEVRQVLEHKGILKQVPHPNG